MISDLRYGVRMLLKTPGLTIVAVLTIMLGVGLTTHTFSIVYGSVLRGLDFDRGTPLVSLSQDTPSEGHRGNAIPILDLIDWREQQTSFRGLAGFSQAVAAAQRIDPGLPLYWLRTIEESVQTSTWIFTIFGSLFTTFGVAALFLAAVGLYGVMAFSVGRRRQEMGIRMAMGAGTRAVFGLVLGKGMRQLALGAAIGLALGAAMARPLAVVFFDVRPSDPTVYGAIIVTMTLAGLLACVLPARRATQVELVDALRPD